MAWLAHQLAIHRELKELDTVLTPFDFGAFLDQAPSPGSPVFLSGRGVFSRLHELLKLLSQFKNCVAGMVNDAEKLNFLKC